MPRFFNRIRKQLAKDNKFLQYSRYAIGEILLVVIGILIALQIDNWNEERKFIASQRSYLEDLRIQVINDTIVRFTDALWFGELMDQEIQALSLIKSRSDITDSVEYRTISLAIGNAPILMARTSNIFYSESIMDKIDPELNLKLIDYIEATKHSYNVFQKLSESLQRISERYIVPAVYFQASSSTLGERVIEFDFASIKDNRALNNVLENSIIYREGLINDIQHQIGLARIIIVYIDSLLNTKSSTNSPR